MLLQMMNQDPNVQFKLIDRDGWKGFSTVTKGKSAEAVLFVPECLLTVNASMDEPAVLDLFLKAIDLKGMAKALSGGSGVAPAPPPK
jgi:hypothetical protein